MHRQPNSRFPAYAILLAALFAAPTPASPLDVPGPRGLGHLQVPFVENCGQWDSRFAFAADTSFGAVFVTREGQIVYSLDDRSTLVETLVSGKPVPQSGPAAVTRVSYFRGADPSRWQQALPSYDEISLGAVWRGVSVSLVARGGSVEKLFTVQPGANVGKIRLRLEGAISLRIDTDGALVAQTSRGEVRFSPPVAYQEANGARSPVAAAYTLHGRRYGFLLGSYDHSRPVVVDPLLQSTYLGGSGIDSPHRIAVHPSSGEVIVAGSTASTDFPGTAGGAQPAQGGWLGSTDGFVARLDPTLTTLLQATYLGGISGDGIDALAIHPSSGEIVVAGDTNSNDFPMTAGGAQPGIGGQADGFVARLNPDLTTLLQATYLGGTYNDSPFDVSIHPTSGEILVAGYTYSTDFPTTAGGAQPAPAGNVDGFVARLDASLSTLQQATYLGGGADDWLEGLAIHPTSGEIVLTGRTESTDFPGAAGGAQPAHGGGAFDGFIARLDSTLTMLLQSTYLGGSGNEYVHSIVIPPWSAEVFVAGHTDSTDLPGTAGGAQPVYGGGAEDGFVARLDSSLTTLVQSSYLGGTSDDRARALEGHASTGEILVAGCTDSSSFPGMDGGAQPASRGDREAFVARLDNTLHTLLRATFIGGTGYDDASGIGVGLPPDRDVLVIGETESTDFSATAGGAQPAEAGGRDGFVARLTPDLTAILSPFGIAVDTQADPGDGDFVFEAGEGVTVLPLWQNRSDSSVTPTTGRASEFTGPTAATYTIVSDTVSYQTIPPGGIGFPPTSYYVVSVSIPPSRPLHWDAWFTETLDVPYVLPYRWSLHVGESFPDVPRSNRFYRDVETALHNGITAGCGGTSYCPDGPVTRAQMASFLLLSKHGPGYLPPPCTGIFADVPCPFGFSRWIEQLFREGITAGCGGDNYCPTEAVTRDQMAAFLLKTMHGSDYVPTPCSGYFGDVPCPSPFADWIEELAAAGITVGCSGGNYCPDNPNIRGQMAVFLVKAFGLRLYGP